MQTTLENIKKVVADSPRSAFERKNKVEEGRTSGSRVKREQENTDVRAQRMMRGTICSANNCTSSQTNYRNTTNDNSTRETIEGVEVRGTIGDISTREIVEGTEPRN
jgi:hypothetical protein